MEDETQLSDENCILPGVSPYPLACVCQCAQMTGPPGASRVHHLAPSDHRLALPEGWSLAEEIMPCFH